MVDIFDTFIAQQPIKKSKINSPINDNDINYFMYEHKGIQYLIWEGELR